MPITVFINTHIVTLISNHVNHDVIAHVLGGADILPPVARYQLSVRSILVTVIPAHPESTSPPDKRSIESDITFKYELKRSLHQQLQTFHYATDQLNLPEYQRCPVPRCASLQHLFHLLHLVLYDVIIDCYWSLGIP